MFIDIFIAAMYGISLLCALYIVIAHGGYFRERFKSGVVNLFMLAMLFFVVAYIIKMTVALWIRISTIIDPASQIYDSLYQSFWAIAMLGTTMGFVILAVLTYRKRYDLFIFLRRSDERLKKQLEESEDHEGA